MEQLLKYLILTIRVFWDEVAVIQNNTAIKYIDIFKEAYELSNAFKREKSKKLKIAICANNSIEWIISFLAIILSNNTLVIISPSLGYKKISHILAVTGTNILISDSYFNFNGIIYNTKKIRSKSVKNIKLFKVFRELINSLYFPKIGDDIIIYTPNKLKEVKISYIEILILLRELKTKEIFKSESSYLAYPEFSYNYVLGMLLPLVSNTKIIIPNDIDQISMYGYPYNLHSYIEKFKFSTLIITADQFHRLFFGSVYKYSKKYTLKERFKAFLSIRFKLYSIEKLIIKNRLQKLFPNLEKLIILNSSLGFNIEKLLKKINFPYTVTYGTIETCGIATYSHPFEHKIESVGKEIINNIIVENNIIFHLLHWPNWKNKSLNDVGIKDRDGNIYFLCRTSEYSSQSKKIEDILSYIPFISEYIIRKSEVSGELPYLLVNVDFDQAESKGITSNKEIYNIIDSYIKKLSLPISKIIIWKSKFPRDTYGRIVNV